jgi:hypothetical protein
MKSVKLNESELELIRNLYEEELAFAENYIMKIQDLLKKLGGVRPTELPVVKEVKKRGRKPKKVNLAPKVGKKRGRKPAARKNAKVEVAAKPVEKVTPEPKRKPKPVKKKKPVKRAVSKPAPVKMDSSVETPKE